MKTSSTFRKECVAKKVYLDTFCLDIITEMTFHNLLLKLNKGPEDAFLDYCYVLYRWLADKQQQILVRRHGNAQKPFLGKRKKLFFVLQNKHITKK